VVALDRASTCALAERQANATRRSAANCRRALIAAVPDTLHPVWPDHGPPFTALTHVRNGAEPRAAGQPPEGFARLHAVEDACEPQGIEPRLPQPGHPWTNGQVDRRHRTLKEATVKRDDDEQQQPLKAQLDNVLKADNVAKRLKTLQGLTPDEDSIKGWQKAPERLTVNPCHHTLGLNTAASR
jgi:hypothetical protein